MGTADPFPRLDISQLSNILQFQEQLYLLELATQFWAGQLVSAALPIVPVPAPVVANGPLLSIPVPAPVVANGPASLPELSNISFPEFKINEDGFTTELPKPSWFKKNEGIDPETRQLTVPAPVLMRKRYKFTHTSVQCPICGKTISRKANLRWHMETHSPKKPHRCDICKAIFMRRWSFEQHKRVHYHLLTTRPRFEPSIVSTILAAFPLDHFPIKPPSF